jgi:peptidoglycan hydrolase CwlO-like protein
MSRCGRISFAVSVFSAVFLLSIPYTHVRADSAGDIQTQIDAHNQQIAALSASIAKYQAQLDTLGKQKTTLQSTISSLTLSQQKISANLQITQNKIASANLELKQLGSAIGNKENQISSDNSAVASSIKEIYERENSTFIETVLGADQLPDAWIAIDEAGQLMRALTSNVQDLASAKAVLTNNRSTVAATQKELTTLQKSLTTEQRSLAASKAQQQSLLSQTKNSESNYQKLLATAKAQLASFSTFTTGAGGSGLLANRTVCDDWGCYYSQRDTAWGNISLSGTQERLAADGCLVTSMAMVLTHYGYKDVTPLTINSDPGNFSAVGGLLLATVNVDGVSATRVAATIDATLASGNPAIVGIKAYGGTHFVVLVSGSKGKYVMRDPYLANGKDVNFTSSYAIKSIYEVNKVVFK